MPLSLLEDFTLLVRGEEWDPHRLLGLHTGITKKIIRIYRPGAESLFIELLGQIIELHARDPYSGIFEVEAPLETQNRDYRIYHQNGLLAHDPYAFSATLGETDLYLFQRGVHYLLYETLGAHLTEHQGCKGVKFAVWAPAALRVSLVGDFNAWDGRVNPMRNMGNSGIWELFVPGLMEGERYKFEVKTQDRSLRLKADPYAFASEVRPQTASKVFDVHRYKWQDQAWMERRKQGTALNQPMVIYEMHIGSWRRPYGTVLNYRQLAIEVAEYCKEMHFTHVELLPIMEHPLDESWGYQVIGFFSVTSRYGTPEDFQFFVDHLHQEGIGVLLDWVPAHFPTDDFALARFDGTALYEHEDPRQGYHPHWHTYIFNYGRREVSNFLMASALYWLDHMHIDGLRVDAVASMLYLDYGREEGEWIPNRYGGKENLEAIEFLKHLNSIVHQRVPGVLMIAEESTSFTGVTHDVMGGGLGFDYKWNMGWMNDTLRYFHYDCLFRKYHHHDLTFGLLYAFSERFILVLSHDEVVHGKGSLLAKMPGDDWQKFANMRLLYSYMLCQPGKKMLFMGCELGQWEEWRCKEEIHWSLLQYPMHKGIQHLVAEMNQFYQSQPALWASDGDHRSFQWVNFGDINNSIISYLRQGDLTHPKEGLFCLHNFTPSTHEHYFVSCGVQPIKEVFNTDDARYGGSGKLNLAIEQVRGEENAPQGFYLTIPPLSTIIIKVKN